MTEDFRKHHPIWALDAGDLLVAKRCLHMEESGQRVFTTGQRYIVQSLHPLMNPPYVVVTDDTGEPNRIQADFLTNFECVFASRLSEQSN